MGRPAERRAALAAAYGWRCHYCGCALEVGTATEDHIVPRALGGGTWLGNLTLACGPCNSRRSDRLFKCSCARCRAARNHEFGHHIGWPRRRPAYRSGPVWAPADRWRAAGLGLATTA